MAAAPPVAIVAPIQAELVGWACPRVGSDTATKSASDPQVMAAAHQVRFLICWRIHKRRSTRAKTSSVTSSGCTTDICPLCSASAWKMKDPPSATQPNSHSGFETPGSGRSANPWSVAGSLMLAMCCVTMFSALENAAASANRIVTTGPPGQSGQSSGAHPPEVVRTHPHRVEAGGAQPRLQRPPGRCGLYVSSWWKSALPSL